MFYPVRVFNKKGKLKKELSTQTLSKRYWTEFEDAVRTNIQINTKKGRPKKRTDVYEPQYDPSFFSED